jgi:hypothetical protein
MDVGRPTPRPNAPLLAATAPPLASQRQPSGSVLARHFLSRLERLVQIRQTEAERLTDEGIRLIDRTIYATLCDCIDAGAGEVARAVLQSALAPSSRNSHGPAGTLTGQPAS